METCGVVKCDDRQRPRRTNACKSEMDYYAILNVGREASKEEITLCYRNLAIVLSPLRDPAHDKDFIPEECSARLTHMTPLPLHRQWEYINMAYDVLGNDLLRAIYDRFGECGLFEGVALPNGYHPPYQYHGDHLRTYYSVFGSNSPYANLIDSIAMPPPLISTKDGGIGTRTKDPPVEKILHLTLEEVYAGAQKLMHVWRQEFVNAQRTSTEKRRKSLLLNLAPGVTAGTRYCFKEEGDRDPSRIPADIIFIIADQPHKHFERRNHHDLVFKHKINLCQALCGCHFTIRTLDKRNLKIVITDVITPNFVKTIPGEGLPKCTFTADSIPTQKPSRIIYGDLLIEFEIEFPSYLNKEMKKRCRELFEYLRVEEHKSNEDNRPLVERLKLVPSASTMSRM